MLETTRTRTIAEWMNKDFSERYTSTGLRHKDLRQIQRQLRNNHRWLSWCDAVYRIRRNVYISPK